MALRGDRSRPAWRVLAHRDGHLVEPARRGAAQNVERADPRRGQDEAASRPLRRAADPRQQRIVGKGADRGDEKIGAGLDNALAMIAHRLMTGAFEHGVEAMREEPRGVGGDLARSSRRRPRLAH